MRDDELLVAKTPGPLRLVGSFQNLDLATLNPTMVVISREPDGRIASEHEAGEMP